MELGLIDGDGGGDGYGYDNGNGDGWGDGDSGDSYGDGGDSNGWDDNGVGYVYIDDYYGSKGEGCGDGYGRELTWDRYRSTYRQRRWLRQLGQRR